MSQLFALDNRNVARNTFFSSDIKEVINDKEIIYSPCDDSLTFISEAWEIEQLTSFNRTKGHFLTHDFAISSEVKRESRILISSDLQLRTNTKLRVFGEQNDISESGNLEIICCDKTVGPFAVVFTRDDCLCIKLSLDKSDFMRIVKDINRKTLHKLLISLKNIEGLYRQVGSEFPIMILKSEHEVNQAEHHTEKPKTLGMVGSFELREVYDSDYINGLTESRIELETKNLEELKNFKEDFAKLLKSHNTFTRKHEAKFQIMVMLLCFIVGMLAFS